MDTNIVWWGWVIVAAIFLIIELTISTFFGLWMALAAVVPAVLSFIVPDLHVGWQIAVWIVSMLVCAYLWIRNSKRKKPRTIQDSIIGQIGILSRRSSPERHGLLILQKPVEGMTEWTCVSDEEIEPNSRVVVVEKHSNNVLRVTVSKTLQSKASGS